MINKIINVMNQLGITLLLAILLVGMTIAYIFGIIGIFLLTISIGQAFINMAGLTAAYTLLLIIIIAMHNSL